jgi:type II restriction enzyme
MISPICEKAIEDALLYKNALLKFISPNDAGATGSHQAGILLPKSEDAWKLFTPVAPIKGKLTKQYVSIIWNDSRQTDSIITWYGKKTRAEYRLTRFGKDFPFLIPDTVGDLMVLIPKSATEILGYVLDQEEDIEEFLATLGVEPFERWAIYRNGTPEYVSKDECIEKQMNEFAKKLEKFPPGSTFSEEARSILEHCFKELVKCTNDECLMEYMDTEYKLFQTVERKICQPEIARLFKDVEDFLQTAGSIYQRRKSRAGRSLENHVDHILSISKVPHEMRPNIDGRPDIVIPNKAAYEDASYSRKKLFIVGVKTTCKDRWRQVLNEGKKVKKKHILTTQPGISANQLTEMHEVGVSLIVPKKLQSFYPKGHPIEILDVETFIKKVNAQIA